MDYGPYGPYGGETTAQWRCALCGRFMRTDAKVVDVSHANIMAYEPPDPEWAHEECNAKPEEKRT